MSEVYTCGEWITKVETEVYDHTDSKGVAVNKKVEIDGFVEVFFRTDRMSVVIRRG